VLGNILQQNVRLLKGPAQCDANYCPYFCEKYTSLPYLTVPESVEVSTTTL
jgi:hypothetical protein